MRTALITGGNRGIGLETGRQLVEKGLQVVLGSRDAKAGEEAARTIGATSVQLDVEDDASVHACVKTLRDRGVHVDVLVNNGGVYSEGSVLSASDEEWRENVEVNLMGPLRLIRAFVPAMLAQGYGRVVNVSSGFGSFADGLDGPAAYCVSKAALNALTLSLARSVRGDVKVNAVCPGWVRTRMGGAGADRSVEDGARGVTWLATLPPDGPNGGFFRDGERIAW